MTDAVENSQLVNFDEARINGGRSMKGLGGKQMLDDMALFNIEAIMANHGGVRSWCTGGSKVAVRKRSEFPGCSQVAGINP